MVMATDMATATTTRVTTRNNQTQHSEYIKGCTTMAQPFSNSPASIYAKKIRRFEKESTYGFSFIKKYTLRGSNPGPTD